MLFIQEKLHLQHLHKTDGGQKTKPCSLRILRVKETEPSCLDKHFLFFILTAPDFSTKIMPRLWKHIKDNSTSLWKVHLEQYDSQLQLTVDDTRLLSKGTEIEFSKTPTPSLVCISDFKRDVGQCYSSSPIPILLVDKHLIAKLSPSLPGYVCKLGSRKDSQDCFFGFDRSRQYYWFNSDDLSFGIVKETLSAEECGTWKKCILTKPVEPPVEPVAERSPVEIEHSSSDQSVADVSAMDALSAGSSHKRKNRTEYVNPRMFGQDLRHAPCHYEEGGVLDVLERVEDMLVGTVELKYYESGMDNEKHEFLFKALKFVCGCVNARVNGTIYFGVPEGPVKDKGQFEYGEIVGVRLTG
jgi:hypothetical protein